MSASTKSSPASPVKLCTRETVKDEGLNVWVDSSVDGNEPKVEYVKHDLIPLGPV